MHHGRSGSGDGLFNIHSMADGQDALSHEQKDDIVLDKMGWREPSFVEMTTTTENSIL